jgi:hypothetical protein
MSALNCCDQAITLKTHRAHTGECLRYNPRYERADARPARDAGREHFAVAIHHPPDRLTSISGPPNIAAQVRSMIARP